MVCGYVRNGNKYLIISSPANLPHHLHCATFYLRGLQNLLHAVLILSPLFVIKGLAINDRT